MVELGRSFSRDGQSIWSVILGWPTTLQGQSRFPVLVWFFHWAHRYYVLSRIVKSLRIGFWSLKGRGFSKKSWNMVRPISQYHFQLTSFVIRRCVLYSTLLHLPPLQSTMSEDVGIEPMDCCIVYSEVLTTRPDLANYIYHFLWRRSYSKRCHP